MAMTEIARLKAPITGAALVAFLHHHPAAVVTAGATRPPCLIISVDDSPAEVPHLPDTQGGTSDVHVHNAT